MTFVENLAALPDTEGSLLRLFDEQGLETGVIENAPGTAGSFRIYAYLAAKHGEINAEAAEEGLTLYAEHAEDARLNPRKHPNIDRLLEIQSAGRVLSVRIE
jgi:hypothetical protein